MNFEKDLAIDPSRIDEEWLNQPQMFYNYAKTLVDAELERDDLKLAIDFAKESVEKEKAEVSYSIRTNPTAYGLKDKPTEGAVTDVVKTAPGVVAAQAALLQKEAEFNNSRHKVGILLYAVKAMDQRKSALENLVRLHGQNYFSGPVVPRDLVEEHKKSQERSDESVGKKMQNSRRTNPPNSTKE